MDKFLFIDEDISILTDESARRALEARNDSEFLVEGQGVPRVTYSRWLSAQAAERKHWTELGVGARDDRNYEHMNAFDCYSAIRGSTFDSVIEIGCGPFTNLRLIAGVCEVQYCALLDPLIREYLKHPHCSYRSGYINVERTKPLIERFRRIRTVGRHLQQADNAPRFSPRVRVTELFPVSIEKMVVERTYDLVVMINVIEHCYDVETVLKKVAEATAEGSIFIFHDRLYDVGTVAERVSSCFDAAHPLQVDRSVIQNFLADNFSSLFTKIVHVSEDFMGVDISSDYAYYIGRKR